MPAVVSTLGSTRPCKRWWAPSLDASLRRRRLPWVGSSQTRAAGTSRASSTVCSTSTCHSSTRMAMISALLGHTTPRFAVVTGVGVTATTPTPACEWQGWQVRFVQRLVLTYHVCVLVSRPATPGAVTLIAAHLVSMATATASTVSTRTACRTRTSECRRGTRPVLVASIVTRSRCIGAMWSGGARERVQWALLSWVTLLPRISTFRRRGCGPVDGTSTTFSTRCVLRGHEPKSLASLTLLCMWLWLWL